MPKSHTLSTLELEPRDAGGTTAAKALRRAGKVPGVVYGHGGATPVTVDAKALVEVLLAGNRSHMLDATIGGSRDSVLIRRIETDPISRKPLSVDFQRVSRDEAISATVTITTTGSARGVRDQGGVIDTVTHALDIKGPASAIPDTLAVDVGELGVHEHILASQVALPSGFSLVTPPETVVISCETMRSTASAGFEEATPAEAPTPET